MSAKAYDFIIVGGGTAGCLVAHRLSHAPAGPSILLVEAGGNPIGKELQAPFYRYSVPSLRLDLDYGYESTPQRQLNDRIIPYSRGKGLGGSSVLNFQVYLYGSGEDYNRWAELVGDKTWKLSTSSVETDGSQNDRWTFQSSEKMMAEAQALWHKDVAYLRHPHDWRVLREAIRETCKKVFGTAEVKRHIKRQIFGPASLSDADIDEFMRCTASTVWHANGSVKMGAWPTSVSAPLRPTTTRSPQPIWSAKRQQTSCSQSMVLGGCGRRRSFSCGVPAP
ncbi:FAD/NAD(P)-binding domain-containing protein [Massarina eburnea CBS 473.64]|uniref:FAD/NAD(P)-binding domain-containing protein n=1 Tax=Massarina eburnea CBS 473.64 TaxID=1395130 RepID=A0A6A6SCN5_9PLEO|nr:FAD/NAD(P)-binding domain-containing protein [Massarina eburnea CBS 473.64]